MAVQRPLTNVQKLLVAKSTEVAVRILIEEISLQS